MPLSDGERARFEAWFQAETPEEVSETVRRWAQKAWQVALHGYMNIPGPASRPTPSAPTCEHGETLREQVARTLWPEVFIDDADRDEAEREIGAVPNAVRREWCMAKADKVLALFGEARP